MDSVPEHSAEAAMSYEEWDEKRKYKRYPTDLSVRFRQAGNGETPFAKGIALDVSRGGMFVRTENICPTGTALELFVDVRTPFGEVREVVAEAKIAWTTDKPGESGMGLCFTNINRHAQYAILASAHHEYT